MDLRAIRVAPAFRDYRDRWELLGIAVIVWIREQPLDIANFKHL
jgi:hypothetical protein